MNGLRVFEFRAALISFGLPGSDHAVCKIDKQVQLKHAMSGTFAVQGRPGALEDSRDISSLSVVNVRAELSGFELNRRLGARFRSVLGAGGLKRYTSTIVDFRACYKISKTGFGVSGSRLPRS